MTDSEMISRVESAVRELRRIRDGLPQGCEEVSPRLYLVIMHLDCLALVLKDDGFDRIPRLISDLAFRGVGFPPQTGMN